MRLTLVLLLAWVQIYCNSAVLSLPPSLIADAASLASQQQELQQRQQAAAIPLNARWYITKTKKKKKKDEVGDRSKDSSKRQPINRVTRNSNIISNNHNQVLSRTGSLPIFKASAIPVTNYNNNNKAQQQDQQNLYKFPNEYEINSLLSPTTTQDEQQQRVGGLLAADATTDNMQQTASQSQSSPLQPPAIAPRIREIEWNEFFTPMKYLARRCQPTLDDDDCLQKNYTAKQQHMLRHIGNRNKALGENRDMLSDVLPDVFRDNNDEAAQYLADQYMLPANNDVLMMLTGEEDLIKFLHWAMQQLQPKHMFENLTRDGMAMDTNQWRKLNLSGQREPMLYVEEPHYMIVRRETADDDLQTRLRIKDDPFIPPRGRKYQQMTELEKLFNRYDTFVPNRGRRDKIKDIFKYDDLFFPNRGKKEKQAAAKRHNTAQYQVAKQQQQQLRNDEAADLADDDNDDFNGKGIMADVVDIRTLPPTPSVATTSNAFWPWSCGKDCLQQSPVLADIQPLLAAYNKAGYAAYNNNSRNDDDDAVNDDDVDNWPRPRMSMNDVKINEYDQSVKTSMPTREMSTAAFSIAKPSRRAHQQQQPTQQWAINNKARIAAAFAKALAAVARQRRIGEVASAPADGVAANRLHSTRSMSIMQQQQQKQHKQRLIPASALASGVPVTDKRWFQLTKFNKNWLLDQQSKQQHHRQQRQQQLKQQLNNVLMLRHLQLLPTNIARQSPPETQLADLDKRQPTQQLLPVTFIDDDNDNDN